MNYLNSDILEAQPVIFKANKSNKGDEIDINP